MPRQKLLALLVNANGFGQAMLEAVKLNRQLCIGAIEIQNVPANHVLPAEFETRKRASAQCVPEFFFLVGLVAAKPAGGMFQTHADRMKKPDEKSSLLTPALSSFSEEREMEPVNLPQSCRGRKSLASPQLLPLTSHQFHQRLDGGRREIKPAPRRRKQFRQRTRSPQHIRFPLPAKRGEGQGVGSVSSPKSQISCVTPASATHFAPVPPAA